jgi:lipid II:glycine glycyltransferase (peptidoglycan interpeptide bridge formation enzyme)
MIDIRQTYQYARYLKEIGWQVERINEINYFIKKFPLIGTVLKIQRPEEIKIKKINDIAKKYKAFQVIIEPKYDYQIINLKYHNYKLNKSPYLPTKTLQIDLTTEKENIFGKFKKDAKRAINKNKDLELKIYYLGSLNDFRSFWKKAVGFKRFVPSSVQLASLKKSFNNNALFITDIQKLTGAIFLATDKIAHYWQAFNSLKGRKEQLQYRIVWQGILWAKAKGIKIFDFEGIYDERFPNKNWQGFTHFKKSFGGYEVKYPGCYTRFRISL